MGCQLGVAGCEEPACNMLSCVPLCVLLSTHKYGTFAATLARQTSCRIGHCWAAPSANLMSSCLLLAMAALLALCDPCWR